MTTTLRDLETELVLAGERRGWTARTEVGGEGDDDPDDEPDDDDDDDDDDGQADEDADVDAEDDPALVWGDESPAADEEAAAA